MTDDNKPPMLGNCTTSLQFKFKFDPKGHASIFAPTRIGMSRGPSFLRLVPFLLLLMGATVAMLLFPVF